MAISSEVCHWSSQVINDLGLVKQRNCKEQLFLVVLQDVYRMSH